MIMGNELEGKVAIITGAGGGIGKAISQRFTEEGAIAVIAELSEPMGRETVREIKENGGRSEFIRTDVSREEDCKEATAFARERFGRLDILVNNAGIENSTPKGLVELSEEEYDSVMNVNLKGAWFMSKYAIPLMMEGKGGAIVNISSLGAFNPIPSGMPYSVSKAGLVMLTKMISIEYGKQGIRANAVAPGWIKTSMPRRFAKSIGMEFEGFERSVTRRIPSSRLGNPEEVANIALFLASDKSSYVSGQAYVIDGGLSIT